MWLVVNQVSLLVGNYRASHNGRDSRDDCLNFNFFPTWYCFLLMYSKVFLCHRMKYICNKLNERQKNEILALIRIVTSLGSHILIILYILLLINTPVHHWRCCNQIYQKKLTKQVVLRCSLISCLICFQDLFPSTVHFKILLFVKNSHLSQF